MGTFNPCCKNSTRTGIAGHFSMTSSATDIHMMEAKVWEKGRKLGTTRMLEKAIRGLWQTKPSPPGLSLSFIDCSNLGLFALVCSQKLSLNFRYKGKSTFKEEVD